MQSMKVSAADVKNKLPELIRAAEDGETVTICRRGVPAVDIVRTKKPSRKKRRLGTPQRQDSSPRTGMVEAHVGRRSRRLRRRTGLDAVAVGHGRADLRC